MFKNRLKPGKWLLALGFVLASPMASALPDLNVPFDNGWTIGVPDDPVLIPGADSWLKTLGAPFTNKNLDLTENLMLIAPSDPLSNTGQLSSWTETITGTSEFVWDTGTFTYDDGGGPVPVTGTISNAGLTITFTFLPILSTWGPDGLPATVDDINIPITIVKSLICKNTDGCQGLQVQENAVPEPGTLLILGAGLAGLAGLRRRSYVG